MHEIALEERKLKLEEDKLKFKHEKWLHEQQLKTQEQQQHIAQPQQQQQQQGACQYVCSREDDAAPDPIHFFAVDNTEPIFCLAANECILDHSEL